MKKEAVPAEAESKKGLTLGKGKLPEEQAQQEKPALKPPMLITPEVVPPFSHLYTTVFIHESTTLYSKYHKIPIYF